MRYRKIPRTDLSVSEIGIPVPDVIAGQRRLDPADAARLLEHAFDLGITFFDASDVADEGESERLLATALGRQRQRIVIGTKGGYDWYKPTYLRPAAAGAGIGQDWSPEFIRMACEASLKRLHTDYIDLYSLHHPGMHPLESEELFDTLATLRKEGKIRAWGIVLGPGTDWEEEGEMAVKERKAVCVQAEYSVLRQKPTRFLFPIAPTYESGIVAADPLADGLLDATYKAAAENSLLKELRFLDRRNIQLGQAALKFVLADKNIVSALVPGARQDRLAFYAAASDLPDLSVDDMGQLRDLYDAGFGLPR